MEISNREKEGLNWKDISEHFLAIAGFFQGIIDFCRLIIAKHFFLTLSLCAFFSLLSIGYLYNKSKIYEAQTTYVYGDLHPKIFGDMIEKLNALIQLKSTEKVARLLELSPSQVQNILKVSVSDTRGRPLTKNYTLGKEPIVIGVELSQPMAEDSLNTSITNYLNSNPFTAERLALKKSLWQDELKYSLQKIATIDSVLTRLYTQKQVAAIPSGGITIENSEGKNAYELLRFSKELLQRKNELENQLSHPDNVIPIDQFIVLPKARMNLGSILIYGLFGIILGYFLTLVMIFWRTIIIPRIR